MEELIQILSDYGVTIIIVALFLWDWITNKTRINQTLEQNAKCLESIEKTNINTSSSLELLKDSMNTQKDVLFRHDERGKQIEEDVKSIKFLIENNRKEV